MGKKGIPLDEWCILNNKTLLIEWNSSKNKLPISSYTRGSDEKVWWKCSTCNNEWEAQIGNRTTGGNGCPVCGRIKSAQNKRKYTDEQIEALKIYYPKGDKDNILSLFPNTKWINIKALARRLGLKQNHKELIANKNIAGKKYNMLTAICLDHIDGKFPYWKCVCECGNETVVDIYALENGSTKSCGCLRHSIASNAKDFTGHKFGMLTAIERLRKYKNNNTYYKCVCECGNEVFVYSGNLSRGNTVSCGKHKKVEYALIKQNLNETDRNFLIYRHISPNGKSYIGITKQEAERRWQNGNGYKTQPAFWRAIKKYGWDNFRHEIIEDNLTEKEASDKEVYYIKDVYNSYAPNGYNSAEGGISGNTKSKPVLQYYNGRMVNFFESITTASQLTGIAQSTIKRHIGKSNEVGGYYFEQYKPTYLYKLPEELKSTKDISHYYIQNIIAEELAKTTISRNLKGSKKVNKYDLDGHYLCTFPSIVEACKSINGKSTNAVCAAVNPNRQGDTAYGFMWKYDTGDYSDIKPVEYKNGKRIVLQLDKNTKEIIAVHNSKAKAANSTKTGIHQISKACETGAELHGYLWKYK